MFARWTVCWWMTLYCATEKVHSLSHWDTHCFVSVALCRGTLHCAITVASLNWMRKPCVLFFCFFSQQCHCPTLREKRKEKAPLFRRVTVPAWPGSGRWKLIIRPVHCCHPAQQVCDLLTLRKRWNLQSLQGYMTSPDINRGHPGTCDTIHWLALPPLFITNMTF